ncbi:hypothetical protein CVT25_011329 [Psilocybe cyanescens]|uniref:Fe2OG dioxygenase domain-containing protein n=1 Tax=Psilocybe cyanescens TaxID=93625 RepID=A0A409WGA2_PSICY|nr:hypothetical protein CVT25_011329 [Psilocybe cyanescens]
MAALCRLIGSSRMGICRLLKNSGYHHHHSTVHQFPDGFSYWPNYFTNKEQRTLLSASLYKLDSSETRQSRVKRKEYWKSRSNDDQTELDPPATLFAPDDMYEFQEVRTTSGFPKGHFDGVIHHYREMHLSSWPIDKFCDLKSVLDRLYSLCPTQDVQTHILHLASHGEILPHVDNTSASGRWILGVSLGHERVLKMREESQDGHEFSLTLPSGSVYLQRDDIRYSYLHSISKNTQESGVVGQRLSIMIRVSPSPMSWLNPQGFLTLMTVPGSMTCNP